MDDLLDLNWVDNSPKIKQQQQQKPKPQQRDAFADLLKTTEKPVDTSKLSLLEKQKLQQQQSIQQQSPSLSSSPWLTPTKTTNNISSPISPSSTVKKPNSISDGSSIKSSSFDILLDPFSSSKPQPQNKNTPLNQIRYLNNSTPNTNSNSTWDFDLLDSKLASTSTTNTGRSTPVSNNDPFDVDILLQKQSASSPRVIEESDDNPLGILAQPPTKRQESPRPEEPPQLEPVYQEETYETIESYSEENSSNGRIMLSEDDEDALLIQLLDMGFSLQESKFAIEATGGQGAQAAIDLLIQNAQPAQRIQSSGISTQRLQSAAASQTDRARRALFDQATPRSTPTRQHARSDTNPPRQEQRKPADIEEVLHVQTEKIMNQAQEIGGFLYKNAASYLKAGRNKVTKAVGDWQEQQRQQRLEDPKGNVRPKWMTDMDEPTMASSEDRSVGQFKDDDDSDPEIERLKRERQKLDEMKRQQERQRQEAAAAAHKARQQNQLKKDLLFSDDQDLSTYVSPSRRRAAGKSSGRSTPSVSSPAQQSPAVKQTPVQPKVNARTRPIVSVQAHVLAKANEARTIGNEKFKLGQFGEAEEAYGRAIEILPQDYDLCVLLYNNRAAARLKTGNYKKCIEDCDLVSQMAKQSGDGSVTIEGITIQWREQHNKSLHRKAEALESIEKYSEALSVYEEILKHEGGHANIYQRISRCKQALNPVKKSPTPKPAPPKSENSMSMFDPASSSSPVVSEAELSKSKAVSEMRAKAAEKEAEDAEKLQKVDEVNARLVNWKAGKEQNLRALLATLDTLIWPGAQWKGPQMSDLINPKKCKINYMKAISKVHPDKLPADTTVEQRMIASGIFSTLNEAWDSFKAQNQL